VDVVFSVDVRLFDFRTVIAVRDVLAALEVDCSVIKTTAFVAIIGIIDSDEIIVRGIIVRRRIVVVVVVPGSFVGIVGFLGSTKEGTAVGRGAGRAVTTITCCFAHSIFTMQCVVYSVP